MGKQQSTFKIKGPMSHHRATSCPMALKLRQKKVPEEPRARDGVNRRDLGSARHEAGRLLLKGYLAKRKWAPMHNVMRFINKKWPDVAELSAETEEKMKAFTENFEFTPENALGNEMNLAIDGEGNECSYDDCPSDGWRGRLDYVEADGNLAVVTDFKNQMNILPRSELATHSQVAGVYPWLLHKAYPQLTEFKVGIFYFEYGFHQIVELTLEEVEANFRRVESRGLRLLELKEEEIFPEPGPGRCNFCDWLEACPEGKKYMDTSGPFKVTSARQALELAKALEVNKERIKAQEDALKVWVKEHGNVEIEPGLIRGFRKTKTKAWDKEGIKKLADSKDKDFTDLVNISAKAAERWLKSEKKNPADYYELVPGTEFTSFKVKPDDEKKGEKKKEESKVIKELCNNVKHPYGWKCSLEKGHQGNHIQYDHTTAGERFKKNEWTNQGN